MIATIEVKDLIPSIKQEWDGGNAVLITGSKGIGKTSLIRNAARELKMGLAEFNLLSELKDSFMEGICRNIEQAKGAQGTILFFDNLNKIKSESLNNLQKIVSEKAIKDFSLKSNVCIIAAGTSGIGFEERDFNISNALEELEKYFSILHVDGNSLLSSWLKWAKNAKLHPYVLDFIENFPEYLHYTADEDNWAVPASWETASKYIRYLQKNNTPIDFIIDSVGYSHIGKPAFDCFKNYVLKIVRK